MSRTLFVRLASAFILGCATAPSFAQSAGTLRVTVTDTSGAVVPGATVVLTSEATKFSREGTTDAKGGYFFASVDPGTYGVKVEVSGFKTRETTGVRVSANDTLGLDFALEIGSQSETIVVTAQRELIQTETGAREGLITAEQIESLSIIGRNPLELLRILPGVVAPDQSNMERAGMFAGASGEYSVNGGRPQNLGVTLDGANLRDVGANSGTLNVPNNEFVAEIKVQASNYAAEFGSSGVQVQAITKSGSAEFHGSVFDYVRNYRFAANDRSRSYAGQERPKSSFQYPGFTLSGPILVPGTDFNKNRDRAFFFLGFELSRQKVDEGAFLGVTPTPGQRMGLFNDYLGGQHLNQPDVVNIPFGFPGQGTPAPNNDLRPYIDPIGRTLMSLYPLPNYDDRNNRYNYIFGQLAEANRNQLVARIDYNVSENTRAYVRLARDEDANEGPRGLWWASSGVELPTPVESNSVGRSAVLNVTSVLSPKTTNEVIITWSQLKNDNAWQDPSKMELATYGITGFANPLGASPFVPQIVNQFDTGRGSLWTVNDVDNIFSYNGFIRVADNVTKVLNTHAIKIGMGVERQYKRQNLTNKANVELSFAPWANGSTGSDFGDLLVGRPASAGIGTPSAIGNFVAWNVEGYIQDSWKVRSNLTLEYGIRMGKWTNNAETNDLGAVFLPERYDANAGLFLDAQKQRVNGLAYVRNGDVDPSLSGSRPLLVMPRVNFAWDLNGTGNTILRGGAGLFFTREQGNVQYGIINVAPNAYGATLDSYALAGLGGGRGLTYTTLGLADPLGALNGFDLSTVSPHDKDWPRMFTTSVSVARRIPLRQVLEVGYVGTFGRHLAAQRQFNVIPVGGLSAGTLGNADLTNPLHRAGLQTSVVNSRRPFPTLQNVSYFAPIAESNYHALQTTLSRASGSFQYLVAYTFSRARGTVGGDNSPIDPLDPGRSYGVTPFDRTHILNFSWTLRLGDPAHNAFAGALVNGWNVSGISTYASGQPLRFGFSGDISTDDTARGWWGTHDYAGFSPNEGGVGDITPTFTCDPRLGQREVGQPILNVSCIGIPAFGQSGPTSSPYDLRLPSRNFHDLTLFKNFMLGRSRRIQFRAGLFNMFNQAFASQREDIDLNLQTSCNVRVDGVPDGTGGTRSGICDPRGGFQLTPNTQQSFGKIVTKRGHRVVEFALRLFF